VLPTRQALGSLRGSNDAASAARISGSVPGIGRVLPAVGAYVDMADELLAERGREA
jgi:hypothetical protein